jgi:hypothetical protein
VGQFSKLGLNCPSPQRSETLHIYTAKIVRPALLENLDHEPMTRETVGYKEGKKITNSTISCKCIVSQAKKAIMLFSLIG